jgi:short-subunit dehydrogenase
MTHALDSYGKIDVLVNNAGIGAHFDFADTTDLGVFEQVMRVNYLGAVCCTHFALPYLRTSRGRVAVISSLAGKTGVPGRTAYAASKHALHGFFDSLRIELHGSGVSVTIVAPGFVRTNIRRHALGADGKPIEAAPSRNDSMSVEECCRRSVSAIARRDREVVMRPNWKFSAILKVLAPQLIDEVARKSVEKNG